ncbi:43060_t:CDS:1, partial [Gigaspora margarita]
MNKCNENREVESNENIKEEAKFNEEVQIETVSNIIVEDDKEIKKDKSRQMSY